MLTLASIENHIAGAGVIGPKVLQLGRQDLRVRNFVHNLQAPGMQRTLKPADQLQLRDMVLFAFGHDLATGGNRHAFRSQSGATENIDYGFSDAGAINHQVGLAPIQVSQWWTVQKVRDVLNLSRVGCSERQALQMAANI